MDTVPETMPQSNPASVPAQQPPMSVEVHTMPERFLPHAMSPQKKSSSVSSLTWILLSVALVMGGIAAAVWVWVSTTPVAEDGVVQDQMPVTLAPTTPAVINQPATTTPIVQSAPDPITHAAQSGDGTIIGRLTIQLSPADIDKVAGITVQSSEKNQSDTQVYGSYYQLIAPSTRLDGTAELTLEYFDGELTSIVENSLRIGFEQSVGIWSIAEDSVLDLQRNQIRMPLDELPLTRVAIVSNLSEPEFPTQTEVLPGDTVTPQVVVYEQQTFASSPDADADGLTDVEEVLYGTAANRPDTDLDGYTDGQEVQAFYSPLTGDGVRLSSTPAVSQYTNTTFGYSVWYPSSWEVNTIDENDEAVLFASDSSQFIEVLIQSKVATQNDVVAWYLDQVPGLDEPDVTTRTIGPDNRTAVLSIDGTTWYFFYDQWVVGIIYNTGIEQTADFLATWEMLLQSWSIVEDNT